jgi:hypothetical protein
MTQFVRWDKRPVGHLSHGTSSERWDNWDKIAPPHALVVGSTWPAPPQTSQARRPVPPHSLQSSTPISPVNFLPVPLHARHEVVLWPWHLGHNVFGIARSQARLSGWHWDNGTTGTDGTSGTRDTAPAGRRNKQYDDGRQGNGRFPERPKAMDP